MEFSFYDLNAQQASKGIELLFPGWFPERERVVVFSPHDDDAVIGAGHLIQAAQAFGGEVFVVIFCQGNAGYIAWKSEPPSSRLGPLKPWPVMLFGSGCPASDPPGLL